jgi:hypothetical protein
MHMPSLKHTAFDHKMSGVFEKRHNQNVKYSIGYQGLE